MSKTVYVEITNSYSRTAWDNTGATTYAIGDRVEYNDGSRNIIFVCIAGNNSTTNPNTNTSNWVEAGSEEYPFLVLDGSNNMSGVTSSEWNWYGHSSQDKNFLVESIGSWTQVGANNYWQASAPGATIVLGDGRYAWANSTYSISGLPSDSTIVAKNKGKAYLITNNSYWGGDNVTLKDLVIYSSDLWSTVPGCYSGIYNMHSCLITQETPWGRLSPTKQESSENRQARPFSTWKGGTVQNCTFDYSYRGPSYWFNKLPDGLIENNTFYCRVKHNQYNLFYGAHSAIFKNNIFYIKELYDAFTNQTLANNNTPTEGENILYIENNLSASGASITNNTNFQEINPLFVGAENGNFSLRPASPLIGGVKSENSLFDKYPEGVWVDHNHNPVQSSYSYTMASGDGTNYTFSGDATGTDPTLNANIRDTLTFTNSTGGHPLAIYNSQGIEVASESSGTTTFTPKYPDTYYYQCTVSGHENMRGNIVVSRGTLGSYDNPFGGYYDAIDAGYHDSSATLLFKKGDHELYLQNPGNYGSSNTSISSSFPGGLFFIGEDPETTRFTTGDKVNGFSAFYVSVWDSTTPQAQTPLTIEGMGFHINSTSTVGRGIFSGTHWKSFSLKSSKTTCSLTAGINSSPFDYWYTVAPVGYEFNLSGCEMNIPLSANNGPGGSFLSGNTNIKYTVESCTFAKLDGYNYTIIGPSPIMVYGAFSSSNGSSIKNCIFYSNVGQGFGNGAISSGVFSSCVIHSTTNSFTVLPPDMDVNSSQDPLFINTTAGQEDLRLRPDSTSIGGISSPGFTAQTGIFYVDFVNGDDTNDGTTASNAFKTLTAAHSASIHLDTIVIVDTLISLTNKLRMPGGRKYKPLTSCTINGNNSWAIQIYDTADVDTYVSNFNFINIRGSNISYDDYGLINLVSSNSNSLFVFEGCYIDGIIASGRASAVGGTAYQGCRPARDGSLLKNCALNVGWTSGGAVGVNSQGFVAINYADLIGCTFYVKDVNPLGMSSLFLVGQGGVNSNSHGGPLGPVIVKDCIVHGNNRLSYTSGNSGNGVDLGFVSDAGVVQSTANYVVYNTCFYNLTGSIPTFSRGAIASEIGISNPEDTLLFIDPKFIDPSRGNFSLRPNSPLVGN